MENMTNMDYANCYDCSENSTIIGNSLNFEVSPLMDDSEIHADVIVGERKSIRLWGQVKNCQGKSVANALVKLVKNVCVYEIERYVGVAHTVTDCNGFYQFEICSKDAGNYKLIVGKANTGSEYIIPETGLSCNACDDDICDETPC